MIFIKDWNKSASKGLNIKFNELPYFISGFKAIYPICSGSSPWKVILFGLIMDYQIDNFNIVWGW